MPLLGSAAMLLSFDVVPEAISEHDDWHTHEHLPERLSIPGFLRGTRWVALRGEPRYAVLYEVADLPTLTSPAYLERLNKPSAWTSKMMPHYRGMSRGFCLVTGSFGLGTGHVSVLLRFKPKPGSDAALRRWLLQDLWSPLLALPVVLLHPMLLLYPMQMLCILTGSLLFLPVSHLLLLRFLLQTMELLYRFLSTVLRRLLSNDILLNS